MATDLLGWAPYPANKPEGKVRELLKLTTPPTAASFNIRLPAANIPGTLFKDYFMPYAEAHWPYDGATCNCEDLAQALAATYAYLKKLRAEAKLTEELPKMISQAKALSSDSGYITKPLRAVGGLAHGNVRGLPTGSLDGRCYFPNHTFCKFGESYYDPTFGLITNSQEETVQGKITLKLDKLRIRKEPTRTLVYASDTTQPAARFADSWWELDGNGWISAQDWATKTARGILHTRSAELQGVDRALKSFEATGYPAFKGLTTAFQYWIKRDPKEASARNKGGCVNGLARFLGVNGVNYPNVP